LFCIFKALAVKQSQAIILNVDFCSNNILKKVYLEYAKQIHSIICDDDVYINEEKAKLIATGHKFIGMLFVTLVIFILTLIFNTFI